MADLPKLKDYTGTAAALLIRVAEAVGSRADETPAIPRLRLATASAELQFDGQPQIRTARTRRLLEGRVPDASLVAGERLLTLRARLDRSLEAQRAHGVNGWSSERLAMIAAEFAGPDDSLGSDLSAELESIASIAPGAGPPDSISSDAQAGKHLADALHGAALMHWKLAKIRSLGPAAPALARYLHAAVVAEASTVPRALASIDPVLAKNRAAYDARISADDPAAWLELAAAAQVLVCEAALDELGRGEAGRATVERWVTSRGWPMRVCIALEQAVAGQTSSRVYRERAGVSAPTAAADLRRLMDSGALIRKGGGRSTTYIPGPEHPLAGAASAADAEPV